MLTITLQFKNRYIADPYWPERFQLIEIQKQSGMNRARSEKKKRECLEEHLRSLKMTLEDYTKLEELANRPFHVKENFIIIPKEKIIAALANGNDEAPSKLRIQNLHCAVRPTDFITNKKAPDGVWERFAVVKSGAGKALSNQRGFRSNSFIEDFTAKGEIDFDPEMVKPESILSLLTFTGRVVGIGASRKMGVGRFEANLDKWKKIDP
jgi:hypothetical protein